MPSITDAKILLLATDGYERAELEVPRDKLREAGARVDIATPGGETIKGWDETDWGGEATADLSLETALAGDYDALVLPGGQINPDILRLNERAVTLIRNFHSDGKVVAAICHAPWLLIEAGIVSGRRMTSYPSIRTDLRNAGADVTDTEVCADARIVTSRNPGDLDAFVGKIIDEIEAAGTRDAA